MVLLASYPFLNIYLHTGRNGRALEAEWLGFVSSSVLRQASTEALELARRYQVSGWLANDRRLGSLRPVDLEWAATQLLPSLLDLGVQRFALIESEDPLNKLLINSAADATMPSLPMEFRRFLNLEEARAWASEL